MKTAIALLCLALGVGACAQQAPVVSTTPVPKVPAKGPSVPSPITVTVHLPFWAGGDRIYNFADWEEALRFASDKYTEYILKGEFEIADSIQKFIDEEILPAKEAEASAGDDE